MHFLLRIRIAFHFSIPTRPPLMGRLQTCREPHEWCVILAAHWNYLWTLNFTHMCTHTHLQVPLPEILDLWISSLLWGITWVLGVLKAFWVIQMESQGRKPLLFRSSHLSPLIYSYILISPTVSYKAFQFFIHIFYNEAQYFTCDSLLFLTKR